MGQGKIRQVYDIRETTDANSSMALLSEIYPRTKRVLSESLSNLLGPFFEKHGPCPPDMTPEPAEGLVTSEV